MRVQHCDPDEFRAVEFGKPDASFFGSQRAMDRALQKFKTDMQYIIAQRCTEAQAVADIHDSSFCIQSCRLFQQMSEAEIWELVDRYTSANNKAALGSGILSLDIVNQMPRATSDELKQPLLYLDYIERSSGESYAYNGSATSGKGGFTRIIGYEKAKRLARKGVMQSSTRGNHHLDWALHTNATMHLRVVSVFDRSVSPDKIVLVEGLFTDLLQTIERLPEGSTYYKNVNGLDSHSAAMADSHLKASSPNRRTVPYIGLNRSSPLRQGSGQMSGSLFSGFTPISDKDLAALGEKRRAILAQRERWEKAGCCVCGASGPQARVGWLTRCLDLLPEFSEDAECYTCYQSYRSALSNRTGEPTAEWQREWLATRRRRLTSEDICVVCGITKADSPGDFEYAANHLTALYGADSAAKMDSRCASSFRQAEVGDDEESQREWVKRRVARLEHKAPVGSCVVCGSTETASKQRPHASKYLAALYPPGSDDRLDSRCITSLRQQPRVQNGDKAAQTAWVQKRRRFLRIESPRRRKVGTASHR